MATTDVPNDQAGLLAFLPWVTIKHEQKLGDWQLIPVDLKTLTDSEEHKPLTRVLGSYRLHIEAPISSATIFKHREKGMFAVLTDDERTECFVHGEIVSFASVASREFFSFGYYTNSASSALFLQKFTRNAKGFALTARRRDGEKLNYSPDKYHIVLQPLHVAGGALSFDQPLAEALVQARSAPIWPRMYESLLCYLRANSDDNAVTIPSELIFALGAFERLLDVNNGKCAELAARVVSTLALVLKEEPLPSPATRSYGKLGQATSLREIWIRDFCACRGDLGHGRNTPAYQSIWRPEEHLLLASEIFPIAVKTVLAKEGLYRLEEKDLERTYLFDQRLRAGELFKIGEKNEAPVFGWEDTRRRAIWEWQFKKKDLIP